MNSYIVVEGQTDGALLRRLLPKNLLDNVHVVVSGGKSAAISLSRSILSARQMPTILIIDSHTNNEHQEHEQRIILDDLLRPVAGTTDYLIELAVPEMESILLSDTDALASVIGVQPSPVERVEAIYRPKKVLLDMIQRSKKINDESELVAMLDQEAITKFAAHPLIKEVTKFLEELTKQSQVEPAIESDN
jgi:hypothetical protein